MREIAVTPVEPLGQDAIAELRLALRDLRTLSDMLTWLRSLSPPGPVTEIVTQDEYTHDMVAQVDEARWLAFDTN